MKHGFLLPLFVVASVPALLAGCQNVTGVTQVQLSYGHDQTGEAFSEEEYPEMKRIEYGDLVAEIQNKHSFLLLTHDENSTCQCWTSFHDNVLKPYIQQNSLLVHWIDYADFMAGKEFFGVTFSKEHETVAIFKEGVLAYQHDNADEQSEFTTKLSAFSDWMNARIKPSHALYLSLDQLDAKYAGTSPFNIYYGRAGCGDCSYFDKADLLPYLASNDVKQSIYLFDLDIEGVRFYNGASPKEEGTEDEQAAYAQYMAWKAEYGLAESEDNPAGYDAGMVPSVYRIAPNGKDKIGEVITHSAVFYNDDLYSENGKVAASYFTAERLEIASLSYLKNSSVTKKVLLGEAVTPFEGERGEWLNWNHEQQRALQKPIIDLLLDAILKA